MAVQVVSVRFPSSVSVFLRLLAHFDALDGDEEPDAPLPRYELLYPEDHYEPSPFADEYTRRMEDVFLNGAAF